MRLRLTGCDDRVVKPARQREIGQPVAVDVPHLPAPDAVFDAAKTMRMGFDTRPRGDRLTDQLTCALHGHNIIMSTR